MARASGAACPACTALASQAGSALRASGQSATAQAIARRLPAASACALYSGTASGQYQALQGWPRSRRSASCTRASRAPLKATQPAVSALACAASTQCCRASALRCSISRARACAEMPGARGPSASRRTTSSRELSPSPRLAQRSASSSTGSRRRACSAPGACRRRWRTVRWAVGMVFRPQRREVSRPSAAMARV
jgi:hypothetical protein